jgi:uncharacterized repeat protein (TIGR01451 family)
MKILRCLTGVVILMFVLGFVPHQTPPQTLSAAPAEISTTEPPTGLLKPAGTLDLSSGYRESLKVEGWALGSGPDESPRSTSHPSTELSGAGDESWADDYTMPGVNGTVYAIVQADDGTIYVGGAFTSAGGVVARNLAKWSSATGWAEVGGGVDESVYALALDAAGNLYAGGWFDTAGTTPVGYVAMWNGAAWSDLDGGMAGFGATVHTLLVDGGNVYAAGQFATAGGVTANNVAKWDGLSWSALGSGTNSTVRSLALDQESDLIAGGDFTTAGGTTANRVARWDGVAWTALGSGAHQRVTDVAVDSAGDIVIVGDFTQVGGQPINRIARWDEVTDSWSAVGGGTDKMVESVAIDAADQIYVGGAFTQTGGVPASHVAVWDGDTWSGVGDGMGPDTANVNDLLLASGGTLLAAGNFNTAGGVNANGLALWDGACWSPTGKGTDFSLSSLYLDGDTLYGGVLLASGETPDTYLVKWDGVGWTEVGGGTNGDVHAIVMDGAGNLYIGGGFNHVAYHTDQLIQSYKIAMWDGSTWSTLNGAAGSFTNVIYALAIDGSGNIYAGGEFNTIGGVAANNVAMWNGSTWSPLGDGTNGRVYALLWDNDTLYVGGDFTQAGGNSAGYVAAWQTGSWSSLGSGLGNTVRALEKHGGNLYTGGWFTSAGGQAANYVARWDGANWHALGSGVSYRVNALAAGADGTLYVGGQFDQAGGNSAAGIAQWDGATWSALGSGVDEAVNALHFDANDNLYVAGYFNTAGGKPAAHITQLRLAPFLEVTKVATPTDVTVGETITYTLVVRNRGASAATGIVISDTVPADTLLNAGSLSGDATTTGTAPGSTITWDTLTDLASGSAITRTFTVQVTGGTSIANIAYAGASNLTGNQASNRVETPVLIPSLALEKRSVAAVRAGDALIAELAVHNDGTLPLTGVVLTDTVPTDFVSASDGGTFDGTTVTWQVGALAVGATVTRTCTMSVPQGTAHGIVLTNTAGATADQGVTATAIRTVVVDNLAPTFPTHDPATGSALITPTLGVTLQTATPTFRWHAADGTGSNVLGYTLVITPPSGLRHQALRTSIWTTQTTYTPAAPLTNGAYSWTVRAQDEAGIWSPKEPANTFVIRTDYTVYLPLTLRQ